MTDDANTSISAVAVLEPTPGGVPRLVIYRNLYAAIPIEPLVITRLRAVQRDIDLERVEWITVESGRREFASWVGGNTLYVVKPIRTNELVS